MTTIIGILENNRVADRAVFESFESAAAMLQPGTFVEETESTGVLYFGGLWDGEKFTPPTDQEVEDFRAYLDAEVAERNVIQQQEATSEVTE